MPLGGSYYVHVTAQAAASQCHLNSESRKQNGGAMILNPRLVIPSPVCCLPLLSCLFLPASEGSGEWLPT